MRVHAAGRCMPLVAARLCSALTAVLPAAAVAALLAGCGGGVTLKVPVGPRGELPPLGSLATSGAGHRFYEIYDPSGQARGTVLMLHGGGWHDARQDARDDLAVSALAFRRDGWRVVNVSYSPAREPGGAVDPRPMLRDVVAFYDQIQRAFPGPICAFGQSAGAHLAMLLAVERPSLTCVIDEAGPLDLPVLSRTSNATGKALLAAAFGTDPSTLRNWSPARLWRSTSNRTDVFALYATNDRVVPTDQVAELATIDPAARRVLIPGADPGSGDGIMWLHSVVDSSFLFGTVSTLEHWVNGIAPKPAASGGAAAGGAAAGGPAAGGAATPAAGGATCATLPSDRSQLLLDGDAWQQSSTTGQPIAATRGCSGSTQWQDDGLSVWALPSSSTLPSGAQATLKLDAGRTVRTLSARFRGYLARPQQWSIGLYASGGSSGANPQPVATCTSGRCTDLRLVPDGSGGLIAAAGSSGDPDAQATPPLQTFALPAGTRTVEWVLRCVASNGCSLAGINPTAGSPTRPRAPGGQPAIFSLYQVSVQ